MSKISQKGHVSRLMRMVAGTASWGTGDRRTLFANFSGAGPPGRKCERVTMAKEEGALVYDIAP